MGKSENNFSQLSTRNMSFVKWKKNIMYCPLFIVINKT